MTLIAFEETDGGFEWTSDGRLVRVSATFAAVGRDFGGPAVLVRRAGLYAGERLELSLQREILAEHGHSLVGAGTAALEVLAAAAGSEAAVDVLSLHRAVALGSNNVDFRLAAGFDRFAVRSALDAAHATALAGGVEPRHDAAEAALGPWSSLDATLQAALGDHGAYHRPLLDAVWRAAAAATSRDAFDRLLTLTDAPAPGQLARTVRGWRRDCNGVRELAGEPAVSWREMRQALRSAFAVLHASRLM